EAAAMARTADDRAAEAEALVGLANACLSEVDRSVGYAQGALAIAQQSGLRLIEADALHALALAYRASGRTELAPAHARSAEEIAAGCGAGLRASRLAGLLAELGALQRL